MSRWLYEPKTSVGNVVNVVELATVAWMVVAALYSCVVVFL